MSKKSKPDEKRRMRLEYVKNHGDGYFAPCQACGGDCAFEVSDWAHKRKDGRGGALEAENGLYVHGFRSAPANCHNFADAKESRQKTLMASEANIRDGGVVEWSPEQRLALIHYLKTGLDRLKGV